MFDPFCIWGNEMSMNISQVKKLRKIVRMKKLATNNSKISVCMMSTMQLLLVDIVGPPSAEVCRTVANFPQVDDLRFINPWEA